MSKHNLVFKRIKENYKRRIGFRKLYSQDMLSKMPESERIYLRSKYLRHLGFFSSLLFLSFLALAGVLLLGSPTSTGNENYNTYKAEESKLSTRLDSIYGSGNWEYGVYQTKMDAYRVNVTLSDGSVVEHYYRVDGGNIYRLKLED